MTKADNNALSPRFRPGFSHILLKPSVIINRTFTSQVCLLEIITEHLARGVHSQVIEKLNAHGELKPKSNHGGNYLLVKFAQTQLTLPENTSLSGMFIESPWFEAAAVVGALVDTYGRSFDGIAVYDPDMKQYTLVSGKRELGEVFSGESVERHFKECAAETQLFQ